LLDGLVHQDWVFAVIHRNPNNSTDYGFWQLNSNYLWHIFIPRYWHDKIEFDWKNPYHNTYVALRHIKWLYESIKTHNIEKGTPQLVTSIYWKTAIAYNAGIGTVVSENIPPATLDYAARILERIYK
jgi:hypothetical protein